MKVVPARLEMKQAQTKLKLSKRNGQLSIRSQNIKVNINTREMRNSLGYKDMIAMARDASERGTQAARDAVAQYTETGNQMAQIHKGANIPDILYSRLVRDAATEMVFLPSVGAEISWEPGSVEFNYTPSELSFEWERIKKSMEFVPGSFAGEIKQYPKVEIEYLGDPIYAPPSANPDFVQDEKD